MGTNNAAQSLDLEALVAATAAGAKQKPIARRGATEEEPTPSELWLALTMIPRPMREVPFPRNIPGTATPIGSVAMWPLTQEEQHAANAAADTFTKALFKDPQRAGEANLGYHNVFTNEIAIQILHRACRDVKEPAERPAFPSTRRMRENFSTDEIGVLFSTYCTVQSELGPIRARMSRAETEAMIVRLAEGGSSNPLDSLSWELQRSLAVSTASRLVACWTAMSSAGLPPDALTMTLEMVAELAAARARIREELGEDAPPAPVLETDDAPAIDPLADDGPSDSDPSE